MQSSPAGPVAKRQRATGRSIGDEMASNQCRGTAPQ